MSGSESSVFATELGVIFGGYSLLVGRKTKKKATVTWAKNGCLDWFFSSKSLDSYGSQVLPRKTGVGGNPPFVFPTRLPETNLGSRSPFPPNLIKFHPLPALLVLFEGTPCLWPENQKESHRCMGQTMGHSPRPPPLSAGGRKAGHQRQRARGGGQPAPEAHGRRATQPRRLLSGAHGPAAPKRGGPEK